MSMSRVMLGTMEAGGGAWSFDCSELCLEWLLLDPSAGRSPMLPVVPKRVVQGRECDLIEPCELELGVLVLCRSRAFRCRLRIGADHFEQFCVPSANLFIESLKFLIVGVTRIVFHVTVSFFPLLFSPGLRNSNIAIRTAIKLRCGTVIKIRSVGGVETDNSNLGFPSSSEWSGSIFVLEMHCGVGPGVPVPNISHSSGADAELFCN
jgi:hypothetical protein